MNKELYEVHQGTITLRDKICGGIPASKDAIEGWVRSKRKDLGLSEDGLKELMECTAAELGQELTERVEGMITIFKQDPEYGPYIESRQLKSMFKESLKVTGVTSLIKYAKNYCTNEMFFKGTVHPERLYLKNFELLKAGSSEGVEMVEVVEEQTVAHINGPAGKKSAFKKFQVATGVHFDFELWFGYTINGNPPIPPELAKLVLDYAQEPGLGANRSQGYGKFDLTNWKKLDSSSENPWDAIKLLLRKKGIIENRAKSPKGKKQKEENGTEE